MKKSTLLIVLAVVVVLAGGAVVALSMREDEKNDPETTTTETEQANTAPNESDPTPTADSSQVQTSSINIQNFAFSPAKVTVKKGTKVTWTNKDSTKHDISPDDGGLSFPKSELLGQNESHSFTFTAAGTYSYHCSPHPYMKGTIEVTE